MKLNLSAALATLANLAASGTLAAFLPDKYRPGAVAAGLTVQALLPSLIHNPGQVAEAVGVQALANVAGGAPIGTATAVKAVEQIAGVDPTGGAQ